MSNAVAGQEVRTAVQQVVVAAAKGIALFDAGLSNQADPDWVALDNTSATEACIEIEAAIDAVRDLPLSDGGVQHELLLFLDRAENSLGYSLATVSTSGGDQAKAFVSRARSARSQLYGVLKLSEDILKLLDSAGAPGEPPAKPRVVTKLFRLPANEEDRTKFILGVAALAEECGAESLGGSVHNELDYVELLEAELEARMGERGVEGLRQRFEKQ